MPNQDISITTKTNNEIDIDSHDSSLPVVKIFGTGGTIASKGSTNTQTAGYQVDLNIEDLINSVPDLAEIAHLKYQQIVNLDSKEINSTHLLLLHREIKKAYEEEGIKSIVITHGTDSLEETAFFLELTINYPDIVIVLTGSMRPHSSISSDGSFNLYQAVAVSANEKSKGRGVLVVLNDSIGSGFYITKSNANSLDTFKSIGQGYLELLLFSSNPTSSTRRHEFPEVTILYNYQGFNPQIIELAVQQMDSKALVFACSGAGSLTDETNEILKWIWHKYNIPVVYSKRSMDGTVPRAALPKNDNGAVYEGAIAGGYLNPQKCRILLQLALQKGYTVSKIKSIFENGGIYGG
ncbi:unnamed protein product [Wickerhamomyces anomalus]